VKPLLVINAVGLAWRHLGSNTPNLNRIVERGFGSPMGTVLPAVTCSAQATMLTGAEPAQHGAVGNGWFDRDYSRIEFWQQSNALVDGTKVYEAAKQLNPDFTCAKVFWWWNMGAEVDWSITPRPYYPADGRKIPAVYGWPTDFPKGLEAKLGSFPFFDFWGPKSGLPSSQWIANAAMETLRSKAPTLTLVYLPHLDYSHQRFGPDAPESLHAITELDKLVGELLATADECGTETMVVSEYAIEDVDQPVYLNRVLREAGLLEVRDEPTGERLDPFASRAFAVVDHQVAHIYARDAQAREQARELLAGVPGVDTIDEPGQGLAHSRAGDLVAVAKQGAWFAYPYWLDEDRAPDFARTVAIFDKPGYDPCELFLDPKLKLPMVRIARRVAQKKLGMRYLMDVIPLDAGLVKGSHGRLPSSPERGPVFLSTTANTGAPGTVEMTSVKARMLRAMSLDD
jgi:predicted AlkP superfamily pyrophosphatase or phosphodiesterase